MIYAALFCLLLAAYSESTIEKSGHARIVLLQNHHYQQYHHYHQYLHNITRHIHPEHIHLMGIKSLITTGLAKISHWLHWGSEQLSKLSATINENVHAAVEKVTHSIRAAVESAYSMYKVTIDGLTTAAYGLGDGVGKCTAMAAKLASAPGEVVAKIATCSNNIETNANEIVDKTSATIEDFSQKFKELETDVEGCHDGWMCTLKLSPKIAAHAVEIAVTMPRLLTTAKQGVTKIYDSIQSCGDDLRNKTIQTLKTEANDAIGCFKKLLYKSY